MPENKISYRKDADGNSPEISFYTVDVQNNGASGGYGETIVGDVYFMWETAQGGFTSTNWWGTAVANGPTGKYFGIHNDNLVEKYVAEHNNLDIVFQNWQTYIYSLNIAEQSSVVNEFIQALSKNGGDNCMTQNIG